MDFNWAKAMGKNRDDLIEIVTRLFVLAGIRSFRSVILLPRGLRIRLLGLLRPAEFAARRLIVMAACKLVTVTMRPAGVGRRPSPTSVILGLDPRTHSGESPALLMPKKALDFSVVVGRPRVHGMGPRVKPEDDGLSSTSRLAAESLPAFVLFDPFKRFGPPWLEDGEDDDAGEWPREDFDPHELVGARALCGRIRALEAALQDIHGQAMRLARWRARRGREDCRPKRWTPLRPGRPPGWRKRPRTLVEEVVKECHFLARDAWNTS